MAIFVLAAALTGVAACSRCSGEPPAGTPAPVAPKVFGVAIPEPESIDPSMASEESGVTIARAMFEGLLDRPPDDGPMRPGVAESWTTSPDGRTWTFHLRDGARWTDGRPVTSADFEYAWRRVLDPATGSRSAGQLFALEGARALHKGGAPATALGVSCPDDRTLVVRLDVPTPDFPQMVSYPAWFPVRKDVVEAFGSRWTRPGNLVSNGAFRLKEFVPGSRAELVRNDTWRAAATVKLDGVVFRFSTAERNAYDLFQAGEVHWLKSTLSRDMIPTMRRTRPAEFHTDPVLCTFYVAVHTPDAPLDDRRLRWALNLAVDKEKLTGEVLMGGQAPATGLVSPAIAGPTGYQPPTGPGFDEKAAKALLDEFVRDRGAPPKLTYLYNAGEGNRLIAEFLQSEWKRHLDLDVAVEATEWKSLLARVQKGDYQLARATWCADWVDPANFLEVFESGAASNYPAFANQAYDHELAEARAAKTPAGRIEHWRLAEETLIAAQPILPMYFFTRIYLLSTAVKGFEPNLLDVHPLELLDLQR